ncbi:RHS repeat-associated core domain-containing protein [Prevotella jejuni]|uniref:RHS repeat-associated core domain-containing protein n=1 Tax=Prevotella jejuni TaxID=1177574 RepID=UPI0031FD70DB
MPFKYQSQYEDVERELYYNRFHYYDPNTGTYISQAPIGLWVEIRPFIAMWENQISG